MICIACLRGWLLRGEGAFFRCPLFGQTRGAAPTAGCSSRAAPLLTFGRVYSRSEKLMRASLFSRLIADFTFHFSLFIFHFALARSAVGADILAEREDVAAVQALVASPPMGRSSMAREVSAFATVVGSKATPSSLMMNFRRRSLAKASTLMSPVVPGE